MILKSKHFSLFFSGDLKLNILYDKIRAYKYILRVS